MDFFVTQTSYAIPLSDDDMIALINYEDIHSDAPGSYNPLYRILQKLDGVTNLDYDGFLGSHIYLTIESDHDNDKIKSAIQEIVEKRIKESNDWYSKRNFAQ